MGARNLYYPWSPERDGEPELRADRAGKLQKLYREELPGVTKSVY
jgi:hypothetical protein